MALIGRTGRTQGMTLNSSPATNAIPNTSRMEDPGPRSLPLPPEPPTTSAALGVTALGGGADADDEGAVASDCSSACSPNNSGSFGFVCVPAAATSVLISNGVFCGG